MTTTGDARKLRAFLVKRGCSVVPTGSGHHRVINALGKTVCYLPSSPSDRRNDANLRAVLRAAGYDV